MTPAEVQSRIVDELRSGIGGPGSLRWASHLLVPALACAAGTLCALTLRASRDFDEMYDLGTGLVTPAMRSRFRKAEPLPHSLVPLSSVAGIADEILILLALPQPYKKPSHLVLGALAAVLVQLAELRSTKRSEVLALVEQARAATPPDRIRKFQENKYAH